jgi:hypothetical protein
VHSPIGLDPSRYGITLKPPPRIAFAHNDVAFDDPAGTDHDFLGAGLRKALYNYMHGAGLDADVRTWFEPPGAARHHRGRKARRRTAAVPKTTVAPDLIARCLAL